jgi:hypothetical protein
MCFTQRIKYISFLSLFIQAEYFFPTSIMKMILSSLNLVRKVGVCITSDENGERKLTSEENLFFLTLIS